jgi:hypothetical protein
VGFEFPAVAEEDFMRSAETISGSFRDHLMAKNKQAAALQPRALTAIFGPENAKPRRNLKCPMPSPRQCPPVFRRSRHGDAIIFLHEFAADHTNCEPQMRYFSRGHRCTRLFGAGHIRLPTVPPTSDVYTYKHFYTDALAVLDQSRDRPRRISSPVDGRLFVAADRLTPRSARCR